MTAGDDGVTIIGIVRRRFPFIPGSRAFRWLLPTLALIVVIAPLPVVVVVADHGGREIGSFLACDRPVTPPRCTSVGDDLRHRITFDASLTPDLAAAMRSAMADAYGPTHVLLTEEGLSPRTDVIAFSGDFGDNGAAAWVYCPSDVTQGVNGAGDRWCRHQEMFFNLNPRFGLFFDDDASREHVACHELGHTLGLRHWGNPPETDGPVGATCMHANTPNGPTGLHPTDVDHINAYPYRLQRRSPSLRLVEAPSTDALATAGDRLVGASEVERPRSLESLARDADLVVVGRIVSVEPGRAFGPAHHQLHYAAVTVRVDDVLSGAPAGETLVLEIPLLDGPERIGLLEAELLGSERLLFLRDKATSAAEAGLSAEAQEADRGFHRLVTFGTEILNADGRSVVPPDESGVLDPFQGQNFDAAVDAVREAATGR